jgi:hypothetical protein
MIPYSPRSLHGSGGVKHVASYYHLLPFLRYEVSLVLFFISMYLVTKSLHRPLEDKVWRLGGVSRAGRFPFSHGPRRINAVSMQPHYGWIHLIDQAMEFLISFHGSRVHPQ